ncbi:hypothetical protein KA405_05240 [Patescibacteria group bacterium]|nr:hypothetical protein [Patescibacteria group bacterium]
MSTTTFEMPAIKAGLLVSGKVIKRGDYGILVDCSEGAFTGLILAKEVKNLERNGENLAVGSELEAEMLGPDVISDE